MSVIQRRLLAKLPNETDAVPAASAYQEIVNQWAQRVTALGCEVKGAWLVDWDNGDGYFCWRYPEETISHHHGYDEGFAGRVAIH